MLLVDRKKQLIESWQGKFSEREVAAFNRVRREDFIPKALELRAYDDRPLPLLRSKTISQPTTVMMMTHALNVQPGERVFEVGTGSGYQTALLAELAGPEGRVFSAEVIPELVQFGRKNVQKAGYENVTIFEGNGAEGLPDEAPFDKIIITAACKEFPKALLKQLRFGGVIVGPVGSRDEQEMVRGTKTNEGLQIEFLGAFVFSALYGKYGFES